MKLIHSADIHLGSRINGFTKEISEERRAEVIATFKRMVDYANQNEVSAILISGDLFDSAKPFKKDKDIFLSIVKNNPHLTFFYLRGNHDEDSEEISYDNLVYFTDSWATIDFNGVTISAIELSKDNATSFYSTLSLDKEKLNIVMLHGATSDSVGEGLINVSKLKDKNIDYLALGHYHSYKSDKIDYRGEYAYSGCLEGRGFDEMGEKGFILLEVGDKITHEFIPFSQRIIDYVSVEVTGLKDAYSIYLRAKELKRFSLTNIYRLELIGEIDATIDGVCQSLKKFFENEVKLIDIKDSTKKKIDASKYEADTSIRGEFVREVLKCDNYTEEEKARIIAYGLKALSGAEIE